MSRHIVRMKHPASWHGESWREALMLGNGLTGILVHGAIAEETIQINRFDLWHGGNEGRDIPDISDTFAKMRSDIQNGDYLAANQNQMAGALHNNGYSSGPQTPYPLGYLKISYTPETVFSGYERGIDMRSAEGYVKFRIGGSRFVRKMFVSRDCDTVIFSFTADEAFSSVYTFETYKENDTADTRRFIGDNCILYCSADGNRGARIQFRGDCIIETDKERITVTGKDYLVLIQAYSHSNPEDLPVIPKLSYADLLENHKKLYTPLYDAVSVELASDEEYQRSNESMLEEAYDTQASPALIEKFWRFGRYLFLSAASADGYPVPLYGLWHGGDNMPWSQYVGNENVQMTYWHVLAGGLSYSLKPLIRYYTAKTEIFRECAKKLFGMRGIWLSAYTTPDVGSPCVPVGVIINWISSGGWLCQHFWDYYRYTGDIEFLKSDILPFMREAAQFYLDYAVGGPDEPVQLIPSVSPENTPKNFLPKYFTDNMGHICPAVKNATMDFAIMKETLTHLLEGMDITGMYLSEREEYQQLLNRIPDYQINEDGAVSEWMDPELRDNYYHRHLSHIYPVFPGNEVNAYNRPELFNAFRQAVHLRELGGQSGWSLTHMANIYARLGEGEKTAECLDIMAKSVVNNALVTTHNDWRHMGMTLDLGNFAPVQLDANFGAVSAVQEMLFRWSSGYIHLLPACSGRLNTGKISGIVFPYGTVDMEWNDTQVWGILHVQKAFHADLIVGETQIENRTFMENETFSFAYNRT